MIRKKKLNIAPSRKCKNIRIFLLYLFVMSTFMTVMYYYNADTKLNFLTNLYELYEMESGNMKYDKAFKKMMNQTRSLTICVIGMHIGAFSEAMWYILNCCYINFAYSLVILVYFEETELIFYFIFILIISTVVQNVASDDLLFNCRILIFFCRVIFHNCFIFIIFGVLGYYALDYILFQIIFKTVIFESYVFWPFWILVLFWTFSFVVSLLEMVGSSVTIYYLINQETFTSFYVFKNTLTNLFYNIGNISVGKLYAYELSTFIFLKEEYDHFDYTLESVFSIIIWTFINIVIDFYMILTSDIPNFRMSYTSLFNCDQFNAMMNVETIMFEKHFYEEFRNYFLKSLFCLVLACILPADYYIYDYCLFNDKISMPISLENKTMLYCVMSNVTIWYLTFIFFFSISTTIFYVYVLWPKFFDLLEKKYIDNSL
jgi:hypothetical protein